MVHPVALSQRKTTAAILRNLLGPVYGQERRFGALAGARSVSWVKKVCAGIIPMSEEAARTLRGETGISLSWLLGSPDRPPVDSKGRPYTRALFEWYHARRKEGKPLRETGFTPFAFMPKIAAIGSAAGNQGKAEIFLFRLGSFLEKCEADFGIDEEAYGVASTELAKSPLKGLVIHDKTMDVKKLAADIANARPTPSRRSSQKSRRERSTKRQRHLS